MLDSYIAFHSGNCPTSTNSVVIKTTDKGKPVPYPNAPSMEDLSTFTIHSRQMKVNIPYVKHMGLFSKVASDFLRCIFLGSFFPLLQGIIGGNRQSELSKWRRILIGEENT